MIGDWDDEIGLSSKNIQFSAKGDSAIITTQSEWWWLSEIRANGEEFYGFDIDSSDDYFSIKVDSITFERRGKTSMMIKVEANPTSSERNFAVGLQAGNYFDNINIMQESN